MHTAVITAAMLASFYTTPNGTVIDWYGHVITPTPIVQVISAPKPIVVPVKSAVKAAPIVPIFKPLNDFCWYNGATQFDIACGG